MEKCQEQKVFFFRFYILCENFSKIRLIIKKIPKFRDDPLKANFCFLWPLLQITDQSVQSSLLLSMIIPMNCLSCFTSFGAFRSSIDYIFLLILSDPCFRHHMTDVFQFC